MEIPVGILDLDRSYSVSGTGRCKESCWMRDMLLLKEENIDRRRIVRLRFSNGGAVWDLDMGSWPPRARLRRLWTSFTSENLDYT